MLFRLTIFAVKIIVIMDEALHPELSKSETRNPKQIQNPKVRNRDRCGTIGPGKLRNGWLSG